MQSENILQEVYYTKAIPEPSSLRGVGVMESELGNWCKY